MPTALKGTSLEGGGGLAGVWQGMQEAGAVMRHMFLEAAAEKWRVTGHGVLNPLSEIIIVGFEITLGG